MVGKKVSFFDQRTIEWIDKTDSIKLIDQTKLPSKLSFVECRDVPTLVSAIKKMQIRGAPALGIAGAMGVLLSAKRFEEMHSRPDFLKKVVHNSQSLKNARPTAVNLSWGVDKALKFLENDLHGNRLKEAVSALNSFVKDLADQDIRANRALSAIGQKLIPGGATVLTHCN
jgi:methylthioribose-1-phosphate isomerase